VKGSGVNSFPVHTIDRLRFDGSERIDDQTAKNPRLNTHDEDTGLVVDGEGTGG